MQMSNILHQECYRESRKWREEVFLKSSKLPKTEGPEYVN